MTGRILWVLLAAALVGLSIAAALVHESFTTVADELRLAVPICRRVERLQGAYRAKHGAYGNLGEISREELTLLGEHRIDSQCESGYCLVVVGGSGHFAVQLHPDPGYWRHSRFLSLYCDQTGIVRMSYGAPLAGPASAIVTAKQLATISLR